MGRGGLDGRWHDKRYGPLSFIEDGEGPPRFCCLTNRSETFAMGMMGNSRIEEVALLASRQTHMEVGPIFGRRISLRLCLCGMNRPRYRRRLIRCVCEGK